MTEVRCIVMGGSPRHLALQDLAVCMIIDNIIIHHKLPFPVLILLRSIDNGRGINKSDLTTADEKLK